MTPQETVERALTLSKADGCVVVATERSEANLRWAGNTLTTNGSMRSREVAVISVVGEAAGVVRRSAVSADDLEDLVRASEHAARDAGPAEDAAPLVEPDGGPAGWDDPPEETSIGRFAAVRGRPGRGVRAGGRAVPAAVRLRRARRRDPVRRLVHRPAAAARAADRSDRHQRQVAGLRALGLGRPGHPGLRRHRHRGDGPRADPPARLGGADGRAARRPVRDAAAALRRRRPLLYLYATAASTRAADEGRTVFSKPGGGTRIGEQLAALPLTLRSDPMLPGLECEPFISTTRSEEGTISVFDNGAPLGSTEWIRDGVLTELMRTRAYAAKTGATPRPFIDNLMLELPGATGSTDDLVARTGRGLLLTCVWYVRPVDPQTMLMTGLTRDGVYLVEDGEVTGAVNNFRWNESPVDVLGRVTEAGATERCLAREFGDYFNRIAMPTLRVPDFNMSTVSQAS